MKLDSAEVLKQIDAAIQVWADACKRATHDDLSDLHEEVADIVTYLTDTIQRFAPKGSIYLDNVRVLREVTEIGNPYRQHRELVGILKALRRAYASGYLQTLQELVHADVFSDFMEMAKYLLAEGYKDAAAVIAGGVLEENLRKQCAKHGIPDLDAKGNPKKASVMNDDLAKAGAYTKMENKSVTAWLDVRNNAAHGHFDQYDQKKVDLYLQGILDFLSRFPA